MECEKRHIQYEEQQEKRRMQVQMHQNNIQATDTVYDNDSDDDYEAQ
jgi:hypothetical protein